MAFKESPQRWRRSSNRGPEPICPACTLLGFMLCARCLRWFCRTHIGEHGECVRIELLSYHPLGED